MSGNPATIAMFRDRDEAEFVSKAPWELSPERQPDGRLSAEKAKAMIEQAMREGNHYFEWTHKRLDGEEFPATVLLTRLELKGRMLLNACVRDITEHKRAEEKLKLFRLLIERSNDAIEVLDSSTGRILDANESGCRTLGYTHDEMLSLTLFDLTTEVNRALFDATNARIKKAGHATLETLRRRKDGTTYPVEVSLSSVTLDREYVVAIVRDITERRKLEAQFRAGAKDGGGRPAGRRRGA